MIKTLKTIAMVILATGATVTAANAGKTTYSATNVLQTVGISLTVYEQKADASEPTIASGVSFKTKDLVTAVTNALGTNGTFDKHAELAIATTHLVIQTGTTNVTTNVVTSVPNTLDLSTNIERIADTNGATNLTIGDTAGSYYVTVTATNGTTNILVTSTTETPAGPVSTTTGTSATTLTLDANQTLAIGTNAAVPTETAVGFGGPVSVDTGVGVSIVSNGVVVASLPIGTNSVIFTLTNVTVGANSNGFATNEVVEITNASVTDVVYTNGNAVGYATNSSFNTSLTTTFTVSATNGTTNVTIVTSATDLVTNSVLVTNVVPVYTTNESSELVIADGAVNTPVPTNILAIGEKGTNDIVGEKSNSESDWSIQGLSLNSAVTLKLQGLVHSTSNSFTMGKTKVPITNYSWTDVSGYGTNGTTQIVVGGTITVGSPTQQKIPAP